MVADCVFLPTGHAAASAIASARASKVNVNIVIWLACETVTKRLLVFPCTIGALSRRSDLGWPPKRLRGMLVELCNAVPSGVPANGEPALTYPVFQNVHLARISRPPAHLTHTLSLGSAHHQTLRQPPCVPHKGPKDLPVDCP